MGETPSPSISVNQYLWEHANIIYGRLKLLPEQVANMTFLEIEMMNKGFEEARTEKRWEHAYWASVLVNPHLKNAVDPSNLMKAFLPEKTIEEMKNEKEHIIDIFNLQE